MSKRPQNLVDAVMQAASMGNLLDLTRDDGFERPPLIDFGFGTVEEFTEDDTWSSDDATRALILLFAPGGGGGGGAFGLSNTVGSPTIMMTGAAGGGGGSGGVMIVLISYTAGEELDITIGDPGDGGDEGSTSSHGSDGTAGGDTLVEHATDTTKLSLKAQGGGRGIGGANADDSANADAGEGGNGGGTFFGPFPLLPPEEPGSLVEWAIRLRGRSGDTGSTFKTMPLPSGGVEADWDDSFVNGGLGGESPLDGGGAGGNGGKGRKVDGDGDGADGGVGGVIIWHNGSAP